MGSCLCWRRCWATCPRRGRRRCYGAGRCGSCVLGPAQSLTTLDHHQTNRWIAATYRHAAVLIVDTGRVASLGTAEPKNAVAHAVLGAFAARGCPIEGLREWARDG